jgi:hypothetical protein
MAGKPKPANCRPAHSALLRICLLAILAACVPHPGLAAEARGPMETSAGPRVTFAIADFDGDHHPDFASVQTGQGGASSDGDYWVRVRLSASGKHFIRVAAPQGGLVVEARDVNGDHAVDLVLATAWLGQPVAVLLNDGHGNFSQADPSDFPRAFRDLKSELGSAPQHFSEVPGIPQESTAFFFRLVASAFGFLEDPDPLHFPDAEFVLSSFLIFRAGRAPPLSFSL